MLYHCPIVWKYLVSPENLLTITNSRMWCVNNKYWDDFHIYYVQCTFVIMENMTIMAMIICGLFTLCYPSDMSAMTKLCYCQHTNVVVKFFCLTHSRSITFWLENLLQSIALNGYEYLSLWEFPRKTYKSAQRFKIMSLGAVKINLKLFSPDVFACSIDLTCLVRHFVCVYGSI